MKRYRNLKIVSFVFLIAAFAFAPLFYARAQLETQDAATEIETGATAASAVTIAAEDTITAADVGGLPGPTQALQAATQAALDNICNSLNIGSSLSSTLGSQLSSFATIGGSSAQATNATAQLATATGLQHCLQVQLTDLKNQPITNLIQGQDIQRKEDTVNSQLVAVNTTINNLKAQQAATITSVLKAIALKLLLSASQKLSTNVINALLAKYRIQNYAKYADAVATQIYNKNYISNNFPDAGDQLIINSILTNTGTQGIVMPLVQQKAQTALASAIGYQTAAQIPLESPDFYTKMAGMGSGSTNPVFMQQVYTDNAAQVKAAGNAAAQQEIAGGNGFIPVRNCTGTVQQQQQINTKTQTAQKNAYDAQQVANSVLAAYNSGTLANQNDVATAANNLAAAQAQLAAVPVNNPQPMVQMCQGITNPGSFVGNSIQSYLATNLAQGTNLNNANLPFYGQFLFSVANNFLSQILEGGIGNPRLLNSQTPSDKGVTTNPFQTTPLSSTALSQGVNDASVLAQASQSVQNEVNGGTSVLAPTDAAAVSAACPTNIISTIAGNNNDFLNFTVGGSPACSTVYAGQNWQISITNAAPNAAVYVTGGPGGAQTQAQAGSTDSSGNFTLPGTFGAADIGNWSETWTVGSTDYFGSFYFTVSAGAPAQPNTGSTVTLTLSNINSVPYDHSAAMDSQIVAIQPQVAANLSSYATINPGTPLAYMLGLGDGGGLSSGQSITGSDGRTYTFDGSVFTPQGAGSGGVLGASAARPTESIRGPAVTFNIR